jgi:hypothetical protein
MWGLLNIKAGGTDGYHCAFVNISYFLAWCVQPHMKREGKFVTGA